MCAFHHWDAPRCRRLLLLHLLLSLFLLLHLHLLPIGLAQRNRRCPVICLDHQIKPSVRSGVSRSVTSLPTICLLTKRRRRRASLVFIDSVATYFISAVRWFQGGSGSASDFCLLFCCCCCSRAVGAPPLPSPPSVFLENCQGIQRFRFSFLFCFLLPPLISKIPRKTLILMRLFAARKVSEQQQQRWWWRRRRCVL